MEHRYFSILLVVLMSIMEVKTFAHDIEVANADGRMIYYVWINNNTELAVSYCGSSYAWAYSYSGKIVIPDSVEYNNNKYCVTSIGENAFYWCDVTSVTIPNSVTNIGNYAFYGCSHLTSVTIGNSLTSIGENVFLGCESLTSIVIADGNPVYDSRNRCNAIIRTSDNTLIIGCKNTRIPNSVTSIGYNAFYGCSLTSISIPNSVTSIGSCAFNNCINLTSVTIGNNVTTIGEWAFEFCISLKSIKIPNSVISIGERAFSNCNSLTSVTIGNNVTTIGNLAFAGCSCLKSVAIPNSVTSIGEYAFLGCSSMTSVTIPNSVDSIYSYAFEDCLSLTSVHISDIGAWCRISFGGSSSNPLEYAHHLLLNGEEIKDLVIPNSLTSIGSYAFSGCSGLTSVTIPNSVTSIGSDAFYNCSGLTSINIPNSVTSIGSDAFYGCSGLTSINIPNSVTSIGNYAFSQCTKLTDMYCYAENVPLTITNCFSDTPIGNAILHVPESSIDAYKTTEPWSKFGSIVALTNQELGVECVRIDDCDVEYYQLNGRKSFKPKHGLNIIRAKDGKTKKVVIR